MNARIHADRSATPDLRTEEDFSLPGWTYWDPEFLELERQVVFRKSWHLVCHVNDVPQSGDFMTFKFLNESILTVRGADGRVRSFHNVCRHRAARLVERGAGQLRQAHHLPVPRLDLFDRRAPGRRAAARELPGTRYR